MLRRERQCGGMTGTALVAAARSGARCGYAGVVVDTTGCGDVFHGAYAAAFTRGLPAQARIRYAAAAALKATRPGPQSGIPTRAEVEALLGS